VWPCIQQQPRTMMPTGLLTNLPFSQFYKTLKRFRHPNIITLNGHILHVRGTQHFLVYEYAANGSPLDSCLQDDGNRARLLADTRLSIMFELARAVHFLHIGGCHGWKVFHRDIKSANLCLSENFAACLLDCGLAQYVPDENSNKVTPSVRSTRKGPALFGHPRICARSIQERSLMGFRVTILPLLTCFPLALSWLN
jgi:serine/threonine protein kinase